MPLNRSDSVKGTQQSVVDFWSR